MIMLRGMVVQLRLDLAESPAPAGALWELVGEQRVAGRGDRGVLGASPRLGLLAEHGALLREGA
jgi:hypothetical protein